MQANIRAAAIAVTWTLACPGAADGQDMEPKAYSAAPVGTNFIVMSYTWSGGSVVFDPTLPVSDVHADVAGLVVAAGRSFNFFGDLALVTAALPYVRADVTGKVQEHLTKAQDIKDNALKAAKDSASKK